VLEVLLEEAGLNKDSNVKKAPVGNQKRVIGDKRPALKKALSKAKLCG
jgi:hypothetical protein